VMTQQERNKRRALIVRRQTARRVSHAQREIWSHKRRTAPFEEDLDEAPGGGDDLLADLPEGLLG
jgi:hypothetical protein